MVNKCERCFEELSLVLPYSELDWYKCHKCKRDIVVMQKGYDGI